MSEEPQQQQPTQVEGIGTPTEPTIPASPTIPAEPATPQQIGLEEEQLAQEDPQLAQEIQAQEAEAQQEMAADPAATQLIEAQLDQTILQEVAAVDPQLAQQLEEQQAGITPSSPAVVQAEIQALNQSTAETIIQTEVQQWEFDQVLNDTGTAASP
jgi:hypothetical protein